MGEQPIRADYPKGKHWSRAFNFFRFHGGLETFQEIAMVSWINILRFPNCGRKTVAAILVILERERRLDLKSAVHECHSDIWREIRRSREELTGVLEPAPMRAVVQSAEIADNQLRVLDKAVDRQLADNKYARDPDCGEPPKWSKLYGRYFPGKTDPSSRHVKVIAESLRTISSPLRRLLIDAGYEPDHMAQSLENTVRMLWEARDHLEYRDGKWLPLKDMEGCDG